MKFVMILFIGWDFFRPYGRTISEKLSKKNESDTLSPVNRIKSSLFNPIHYEEKFILCGPQIAIRSGMEIIYFIIHKT